MAKLVAVAAVCCLAAALLAVAAGQGVPSWQEPLEDVQCRQEIQQSPMDACRQVLDRQLAGVMRYPGSFQRSTGMRMQCCQQLQDVSRECRCAAVRRMVRGYEEAMPPLEGGGSYGESAAGEWYYGEGAPQQGGVEGCRCGQAARERYGETGQQVRFSPFRAGGTAPQTVRVRLTKVRLVAARLPTMCRMEPQECSVFDAGQGY